MPPASPAVAFFYGAQPPWDVLKAFDLVVVDPDHVPVPQNVALPQTRLAAYVSVGEVQPGRPYAAKMPKEWLIGENAAWGSRIIDQAAPGWPEFFVEQVIAPLWAAGYRDFFLDTLDSYHKAATTPEARARQEAGLIAVIEATKARFPQARLIFNRGFEILPKLHPLVAAVAAESLFEGYDAVAQQYRPVPPADRDWLLDKLARIRDDYRLPVIAIDYVPAAERDKAQQTARKIAELGFIPWVANAELDTVGIGVVEAMPRRILAVHEPLADEYALRYHSVIRHAEMPLNHLGYALETVSADCLPTEPLSGQVAGIVVWLTQPLTTSSRQALAAWLEKQLTAGMPIAVLGEIDFLEGTPLASRLGLVWRDAAASAEPVTISMVSKLVGFERQPKPHPRDFRALDIDGGEPHLVLSQGTRRQVAVAVMPWGGFAVDPYVIATLP
ncbi:MAG: endo alpha-1,4 polygalactosaminidase, partial [Rhodocyclaceae bacterium]